jgi:hypothetical protein
VPGKLANDKAREVGLFDLYFASDTPRLRLFSLQLLKLSSTHSNEARHWDLHLACRAAGSLPPALSRCRRSVTVKAAGNRRHAAADAAAQVRNEQRQAP